MRITNVSSKTSLKAVLTSLYLCIIVTIVLTLLYMAFGTGDKSLLGFFGWFWPAFQSLLNQYPEDKFMFWLGFITSVGIYISLPVLIISRQIAISKFKSELNLKSVNFRQGVIDFNFNRPQYNFSCKYDDIESLVMIVKNKIHRCERRLGQTYIVKIEEIELIFKLLNNKTFTISNTGSISPINYIYKILDYAKYISNFEYEICGPDSSFGEKIKNYLETDKKISYSKDKRNEIKLKSSFIFVFSLLIFVSLKDFIYTCYYANDAMIFIPLSIPVLLLLYSFTQDILLIKDELAEKSFINNRGLHG